MNYDFLKNVIEPRHMVSAITHMGVKEIPGVGKSNPEILQWAKNLGLDDIYKDDDTAWCALFFAECMFEAGRKVTINTKDKNDYLRALKYQQSDLEVVLRVYAAFGDALIFKRPEGGHIGFYVAEDDISYHVLGGNTSNMVMVTRILKTRLVAVRRPNYNTYSPSKIYVSADGKISSNEA